MFSLSSIVVGIEIGTHKIFVTVAEVGPGGELSIIGVGQEPSRGVRKGDIIDKGKTAEDVRAAISAAERMANVEINGLVVGVSGGHVSSLVLRGLLPIATAHRPINARDVEDAVTLARQSNIDAGYQVIDSVRQGFQVDEDSGIANPVGLVGARLLSNVLVIKGLTNRIETVKSMFGEMQLTVQKVTFTGLASALAVLTPEQKDEGTLLLDMGAGTTDFTLFQGGILRQAGVLPVGGDHVSNDLACAFKLSLDEAQRLKEAPAIITALAEGRAQTPHITLPCSPTRGARSISVEDARKIIVMRVEETFELIAEELGQGPAPARPREVVLCGGAARLSGVEAIARRIFRAPASLGQIRNVSGPSNILSHPEFAAPVGLARYGAMRLMRDRATRRTVFNRLTSVFRR